MLADSVKARGFIVPLPFVHCAAHNLNVVIKDAGKATVK